MTSSRRMCQTVERASKAAIGFPIYNDLIVMALACSPVEIFKSPTGCVIIISCNNYR